MCLKRCKDKLVAMFALVYYYSHALGLKIYISTVVPALLPLWQLYPCSIWYTAQTELTLKTRFILFLKDISAQGKNFGPLSFSDFHNKSSRLDDAKKS